MKRDDNARIHTGRGDRDGRARTARRRAARDAFVDWDEAAEAGDIRTAAYQAARHQDFLAALHEETEAGDEGLDGVHSRDEG